MFDAASYAMGMEEGFADGQGSVVFEDGGDYTFSDPNNDGHIVITKNEEGNND